MFGTEYLPLQMSSIFYYSLLWFILSEVVFGFEQEKELVERHNAWLNDELTAKVDSVIELRRKSNDLEDDMSTKLADVRMPVQFIFFLTMGKASLSVFEL